MRQPVAHDSVCLNIIEVDTDVVIVVGGTHGLVNGSFIDPGSFRQFTILFQIPRLICRIFVQNVNLFVLEITLADQDNVSCRNPYLLSHFSSDVTQASDTVVTKAFTSSVSKHSHNLGVFLTLLLELQFALGLFAVSLSSPTVLPALSFRAWFIWRSRSFIIVFDD